MKRLWASLGRLLPPGRRRHVLAMLVVLLLAFAVRARNIESSLPYCRHVDENTWVSIALRMLRTGDMNPHRFRKPSLPVYLMTAGLSVGYLQARVTGQASEVADLGVKVLPYYPVPSAARPPKLLFALASVLALGLAGWTGAALTGRAAMLWLTPLLASISSSFLRLSWSYMDVDVIGALFVWATLAYLVRLRVREQSLTQGAGSLRRLITLGVLAGLAVGSKYNLFPIVVPCVLSLLLFERTAWFRATVLLGVISVTTFFVTTPFSLVSPGEFVRDLLNEANHYATGHEGTSIPRGLPLLWIHIQHFAENFGGTLLLLSLVGVVLCFRRDVRLSLLVFAHPFVFVAYMSLQRVFFERNVMAVHLHVALGLAVAVLELPGILAGAARSRWPRLGAARPRLLGVAVVLAVLLLGTPWSRVATAYAQDTDVRNRASTWLQRRLEGKPLVLIDGDLRMDARPLRRLGHVVKVDEGMDPTQLRKLAPAGERVFIVTGDHNRPAFEAALGTLRQSARFEPVKGPGALKRPAVVVLSR